MTDKWRALKNEPTHQGRGRPRKFGKWDLDFLAKHGNMLHLFKRTHFKGIRCMKATCGIITLPSNVEIPRQNYPKCQKCVEA